MSVALKAILAAMAQERQQIANVAAQMVALSPISQVGILDVVSANTNCLVDAINRIKDPQGLGGLLDWTSNAGTMTVVNGNRYDQNATYALGALVTYGATSYLSIDNGNAGNQPDISPNWWLGQGVSTAPNPPAGWEPGVGDASYVQLATNGSANPYLMTATTGTDPTSDIFAAGQEFWVYAYVLCPHSANLEVVGMSTSTVYATERISGSSGWVLVGLSGVCAASEGLGVKLAPQFSHAGRNFGLTGVTLVIEKDPGAPFSGDTPNEQAYVYVWQGDPTYSIQGPRNNSRTLRYGRQYDLVAVTEQQDGLNMAPLGLTIQQRQLYLHQRFLSRHMPFSSAFVQLIVDLLQTENPSASVEDVRVLANPTSQVRDSLPPRSFTVQISYDPSGTLITRLIRQIEDTAPYHLAFNGLVTSGFLADISQADIDAV